MTFDEWCASKGYEPRRNGSLYEAWQAAIESCVLAEGKPFAYTTRADLEMMAKHNTATIYREPVDGDIALFTHPTPDDARCAHRLVDAHNEYVESGYLCVDCGAVFAAAMQADKETK